MNELTKQQIDAIVARLAAMAQRYPFVRAERLPAIALLTATRMPNWPTEDPLLIGPRQMLWGFALDDLSDDWSVSLNALLARYATLRAVVGGALPPQGDGLAEMLYELVADLHTRPLWPQLADTWRASFSDLLTGMAAERDPIPPASVEEYMAHAHLSIGAMQDSWTLFLLVGDVASLPQLPIITSALRAEARVIRLSNDLNSAERERLEGKQNALTVFASQGYGDGRAATEAALEQALATYRHAIAQVHTRTGRFEQCIDLTVDAAMAFYQHSTFHEFKHREVGA